MGVKEARRRSKGRASETELRIVRIGLVQLLHGFQKFVFPFARKISPDEKRRVRRCD